MRTFPTLYKRTSVGKIQQWSISVNEVGNLATYTTVHGQVDGKHQTDTVEINQGKNIGKANETTPYEQAISEAESKWKKQKDKGYSEDKSSCEVAPTINYKPMLAHKWKDHGHKVKFPGYMQPKLDGIRCVAYKEAGEVILMSRGNKKFTELHHIQEQLSSMPVNIAFDGELYNNDIPFAKITSYVKRRQNETGLIKYSCYDCIEEAPFIKRLDTLKLLLPKQSNLVIVQTDEITSVEEMQAIHDRYVKEGYEGAMFRTATGSYKSGHKSKDLLKFKMFEDDEFEVIGVEEGIGRSAGQGIFVCKTEDGAIFNARIEGEDSVRQEIWTNRQQYYGKMLTVRFQEWTDSEPPVPRFPVGVIIREYE